MVRWCFIVNVEEFTNQTKLYIFGFILPLIAQARHSVCGLHMRLKATIVLRYFSGEALKAPGGGAGIGVYQMVGGTESQDLLNLVTFPSPKYRYQTLYHSEAPFDEIVNSNVAIEQCPPRE
jgi:hypothetical protein